jgi:thiamine-phosphate pyrophosphorylase
MINKYYFINKFDTNIINNQDKQTVIIYRNYTSNVKEDLILKIKKHCKKRKVKFYLSNNIKLALKLDLDGAYIPSFNRNINHLTYAFKKSFNLVGSAHNLKEIRIKEKQGVKKIFLSSLFKKNKNFLGINKFKILSKMINVDVVALGGISKKNLKKVGLLNSPDFAGISYFE